MTNYNTGEDTITFKAGNDGLEFTPKDAANMAGWWLWSAILDGDSEFLEEFKTVLNNPYEGTYFEDWEQFLSHLESFSAKVHNDNKLFNECYNAHYYKGTLLCREYEDEEVTQQAYNDPAVLKQRQDYAKTMVCLLEEHDLQYCNVDYWEDLFKPEEE